ncbi:MAG TPA: winged helix-turn-helix domain-containing protein, partial [Xanthomonadaceae bacterium]|nr:winged helix-turn-helix domain-containing protein [Xanthomonadaceae bacterium]
MAGDEQATGAGGLYRFAHAEFDVRAHELRVDGRAVAIEAKALQVLACLLARPDETLTKDELFEAVWPGRVVTEGTLTKAVMKLRAVLGDDSQTLIRTVHGFGYRLGVPVEALTSDAPALFVPQPGQSVPFRPNWRLVEALDPDRRGLVWLAEHVKTRDRRVFKFAGSADTLVTLKREITLYRLLHDSLGETAPVVQILDWNLDEPPYFT